MSTDLIDIHAPAIEIQGLVKTYGENEVLKGIDLTVMPGEVVCVIGPSGSGKSTLLRSVNLLEEPTGGRILIEGIDVTDPETDIDRVRTRIGMVFQGFNLFPHLDVLGNLTVAQRRVKKRSKAEAEKIGHEMLERVGLAHKADAYPGHLSGGQQQRVAIARALAFDPKVIIADEVTSALDVTLQAQVMDLLTRLQKERGLTMIFISHDLGVIRRLCNSVIVMRHGEIVEAGPTAQVFDSPGSDYTRTLIAAIPHLPETTRGAA